MSEHPTWNEMAARGFNDGPEANYVCQCVTCGLLFTGHKHRVVCSVCAEPSSAPIKLAKAPA